MLQPSWWYEMVWMCSGKEIPFSTSSITRCVHGTRIVLHLDIVRALGQEVLYGGCVAVLRCLKDILTLGCVYITYIAHTLWSPARYLNNHRGHTDTNKFLDSGLSSHNMSQQTCYSASATFQKTTKAVAFAAFSLDRTFKIWVSRKSIFPRWHSSVSAHFHQKTQQNTITCLRADVTKDLGRNGDCVWTLRLRIHCKLQGFLHSFLATSKTKPILNIENPFWWLTFQTVFSHLHSQFFSRFSAIIFATADLPKCFGSQANHPAISAVAIQGSNQCFQRTSLVSMQRKEDYYSVRKLRCHSVWFYLLLLWKLLVSTSSCQETFLKRLLDFHFFWWGHHWDLDRLHFALGGCRIRPSTRIRQNEASPHLNLRVDTEERTEFIVFIPFIPIIQPM